MKFPHFCLAVSLGTVACGGGEDPATSTVLQPVASASGLDAGTNVPGNVAAPNVPVGSNVPTTVTGSGGDGNGNGQVCEVQSVESGRVTPDMLIVLDRSGSMRNNGVDRWAPSVSALKQITSSLGGSINFGLMTFPGMSAAPPPAPTQNCAALTDLLEQIACFATEAAGGVANLDTCVAGAVDVPIATNNGGAIASVLDRMRPEGATPTAVTLKAAHASIGSGLVALDDVVKPKYVLLVTDGAPNCSTPQSTGGGGRGGGGFDNQAVEMSVGEITAMAKDGVKTYVIGYGTKSDAQLSAALDRMAQAGNTGDTQHHAIEDGNALLTEFQKIAGAAVGCDFALKKAPPDPSYVEVKIDGKQINLNDANGWTISSDRRRITLVGGACTAISSKEQHLLSVRVLCERVVLE
jgi:Mg-chelatase subunit ChlD